MRTTILTSDRGIRIEAEVAETREERRRGLLRRQRLAPGRALLIPNASSIHTLGMRFPIEVAFLDRDMTVLAVRRLPPGRLTIPRRRRRHVLECAVGTNLGPGDRLRAAE